LCTSFKTSQDDDESTWLRFVIETNEMEKLGSMINDPANAGIKAKHTVLEPITISMEVKL